MVMQAPGVAFGLGATPGGGGHFQPGAWPWM